MASGSVESFTLGGRRFPVAADANVTINLGGFNSEVQMNGDGTHRIVQTPVAANVSSLTAVIDLGRGDLEFLLERKNDLGEADFSVTFRDGTVYAGSMKIVDDVEYDSNAGTADLTLNGDMEKQG